MNSGVRRCPVCGSDNAKPLYLNTMAELDRLDMSYRVASCGICGFVFADQLPSPQTYAAYYRTLSKYDIAPTASDFTEADRLRCAAVVELLRRHTDQNARIADLGCGSGKLLHSLRAAGWSSVAGIDPAPGAPQQAYEQFKLDCIQCGTLDQAHNLLNLSNTDVICLTGVLEHLPRLREDLEALIADIGHNTHILVEVPALERFAFQPFEPYGEFSLEHIQYFSVASLTKLFASMGFAALSTTFVSLPPECCDSILGLFARSKVHTMLTTPPEATEAIQRYVAESEAKIQAAIARISACPATALVIYGAGSHTARLLPRLVGKGESRLAGIVDGNPNLRGKQLGPLTIETPETLARHPDATIVISSFRAQNAISDRLRTSRSNPVLTLY